MSLKCSSFLFLALVILFVNVSVQAFVKYDQTCDERDRQTRCEPNRAFKCDPNSRKCICAGGHYNEEKMRCVAKTGENCALEFSESGYIQCENDNAECITQTGSPEYGKCTCRKDQDCSTGTSVGPTMIPIILSMAAITLFKLY